MRHEYTLFKRYKDAKNKKGIVWLFYFYEDDGTRKAKSTGKSLKHEAVTVVEKFLAQQSSNDQTLEHTIPRRSLSGMNASGLKGNLPRERDFPRPMQN
jgi:hypothetical protein